MYSHFFSKASTDFGLIFRSRNASRWLARPGPPWPGHCKIPHIQVSEIHDWCVVHHGCVGWRDEDRLWRLLSVSSQGRHSTSLEGGFSMSLE